MCSGRYWSVSTLHVFYDKHFRKLIDEVRFLVISERNKQNKVLGFAKVEAKTGERKRRTIHLYDKQAKHNMRGFTSCLSSTIICLRQIIHLLITMVDTVFSLQAHSCGQMRWRITIILDFDKKFSNFCNKREIYDQRLDNLVFFIPKPTWAVNSQPLWRIQNMIKSYKKMDTTRMIDLPFLPSLKSHFYFWNDSNTFKAISTLS